MNIYTYFSAMEKVRIRFDREMNTPRWGINPTNNSEKYKRQYWKFRERFIHRLENLLLHEKQLQDIVDNNPNKFFEYYGYDANLIGKWGKLVAENAILRRKNRELQSLDYSEETEGHPGNPNEYGDR